MKRSSNQQSLDEVIREYLSALRLDTKLTEVKIVSAWEKIMGKMIANHTKEIYIKNKVLYLKLSSSVLREELSYGKEKIISLINKEAGTIIIENVVIK